MTSSSSTNSAICPFSQSGAQLLFHLISKLYKNTQSSTTTNLAFADLAADLRQRQNATRSMTSRE